MNRRVLASIVYLTIDLQAFAIQRGAVIAIYGGHDASISVGLNRRVQCVLELERLFGIRYFIPRSKHLRRDVLPGLYAVRDHCECEDGVCPKTFETGVVVKFGKAAVDLQLPLIVEEVFEVEKWHHVDHHFAHSLLGFHSSPFRSAIIISYDGGGNDGSFSVYVGHERNLSLVTHQVPFSEFSHINLGKTYLFLSSMIPEIIGVKAGRYPIFCDNQTLNLPDGINVHLVRAVKTLLGNPGKLMSYAALGQPTAKSQDFVRNAFLHDAGNTRTTSGGILSMSCGSIDDQRALAASIQAEFEGYVREALEFLMSTLTNGKSFEGLVLTGGCALNVLVNQMAKDEFTSASSGVPISYPFGLHVPPASNDGGLTVGALWSPFGPSGPPLIPSHGPKRPQALQYLGFRLWDEHVLEAEAHQRGAKSLAALGGVDYLAELLVGGEPWLKERKGNADKPVIAIVRGRQEFGPRALGHRSIVAIPDSFHMRDRMNRLKVRQWFRPVAPMIADEALEQVFGFVQNSPFMTMAPRVRQEVLTRFPTLAHIDGTARYQSVGVYDEPWLHSLLIAIGKKVGLAALINTSFNSKGKPIINTVKESLEILDIAMELDYVLVGDWLFRPERGKNA